VLIEERRQQAAGTRLLPDIRTMPTQYIQPRNMRVSHALGEIGTVGPASRMNTTYRRMAATHIVATGGGLVER
jgi:hypothetical protein